MVKCTSIDVGGVFDLLLGLWRRWQWTPHHRQAASLSWQGAGPCQTAPGVIGSAIQRRVWYRALATSVFPWRSHGTTSCRSAVTFWWEGWSDGLTGFVDGLKKKIL